MIETLGITLIVIFCVLIFLAQAAGIASFVMLILQGRRLKKVEDELVAAQSRIDAAAVISDNHLNLAKQELTTGQFQMAELTTKGVAAVTEYLNKVSKEVIDSNFDAVTKNTDDVLKLNTENSQKVYDAMLILIQMMNGLMSALGYRPTAAMPEPGLKDPTRAYGQPPPDEDA